MAVLNFQQKPKVNLAKFMGGGSLQGGQIQPAPTMPYQTPEMLNPGTPAPQPKISSKNYTGQLLDSGAGMSPESLKPYLGSAGNVKWNPVTGERIALKDRVKPNEYLKRNAMNESWKLTQGPALKEASDFQFTDLPPSISAPGGSIDQLTNASSNILNNAQGNLNTGADIVGRGVNSILGVQGKMGFGADTSAISKEQARAELADLQRKALAPETAMSPEQQAYYQSRADARLADISNLEGGLVDAFQRQRASDAAQLAAKGVLDSTTASNVMSERDRKLALDLASLKQQANEASRAEQLQGTQNLAKTATSFGGLQGQQALGEGGLMAQLLGSQGTLGANLGGLGVQQQGIGANLAKTGISGIGAAGQLGLGARGQEADLQQAELSTRMLGDQTQLQNNQSILNNILGRQATKQGMDYQQQLMDMYLKQAQSGGGIGGILKGILGGAGTGAMIGGPLGGLAGGILGGVAGGF